MDKKKVEEIFHYFNINSEIDSVFGNWAVSTCGDVVNCLYPYLIPSIHIKEHDWIKKITGKFWVNQDSIQDLNKALERAALLV